MVSHCTVDSPTVATPHKRPLPVKDHFQFVNNCFVSQSNTVLKLSCK